MTTPSLLFSSTELTTAAGCTRKALRYYQGKGLIEPVRSSGNKRYDEAAIHRLRLIVGLRDAGLGIDEITQLVQVSRERSPEMPAAPVAGRVSSELDQLVGAVTDRIEALRKVRNRLVNARETLQGCRECERPLSDCTGCAESGKLDTTTRALMTNA